MLELDGSLWKDIRLLQTGEAEHVARDVDDGVVRQRVQVSWGAMGMVSDQGRQHGLGGALHCGAELEPDEVRGVDASAGGVLVRP